MESKKKRSLMLQLTSNTLNQNLLTIVLVLIIILLLKQVSFVFAPFMEFVSLLAFPVVVTFILYYMMKPLVDLLERRRIPRVASIGLILLVFVGVLTLISWTLFPMVEKQVEAFANNLPNAIGQLNNQAETILRSNIMHPFRNIAEQQISKINEYLQKYGAGASQNVLDFMSSFFVAAEKMLLGLVMIPFMLFYLLRDDSQVIPAIIRKLPKNWREESSASLREIHYKLSSYIRGQLILGLIITILLYIGFAIIGLNYGLTLAILAGFMNFLIPSFGALFIAAPAVIIGFVHSPWSALWVAIIYYIVQHVQSHFIAPIVLSKQLEIHPLTILVLLIAGGKIFGFVALILVIPIYASLRVIIQHIFAWYKRSSGRYDEV
ncbi:MAG: AI-2E family transporter [Streptococcaceae bacterium]|nr:AI-2E family transporter [Streptococcaceae bacterium]